ncbi:hypothetical protein M4D49_27065 [Cupriavidus pauculus]|uniref:hypothetical protein n=1 Tax=Burkholderiaceae TaxID=119060 RepID=UPI000493AAE0|nr:MULTISPECIES: hypothetical protein [Burkholderiaceae]MCM3609149.1 hypothetical protein [Cupriavidus pauculus]
MENNAKEIFDGLIQTTVSEALLADAIELYAEQEILDESDREEFVEKYSDELFQPIIRKAVLDVVVAVVAAHKIHEDAAFSVVVNMLDVEEQDDVVRQMKRVMLRKMADDAAGDMGEAQEKRFRARMDLVEKNLG